MCLKVVTNLKLNKTVKLVIVVFKIAKILMPIFIIRWLVYLIYENEGILSTQ